MTEASRNRRIRAVGLCVVAIMTIGACTERNQSVLFDGNFYPTRERAVDRSERAVFETTVRRADQGVEGAVAAGVHAGTGYCIRNFGTSEIEWLSAIDPATVDTSGGRLVLRGRCVTW